MKQRLFFAGQTCCGVAQDTESCLLYTSMPDEKNDQAVCTYTTFLSSESEASPEQPILILDNRERKWAHHSCGIFTNPVKRTSFEFKEEDGVAAADIRKLDARFVSLLKWLGENHIPVRLSGENREMCIRDREKERENCWQSHIRLTQIL